MRQHLIWLTVCAAALGACAIESPADSATAPTDSAGGLRVLVRVAADAPGAVVDETPAAIETRASAAAGVPVRYLAASGSQWHALQLQCQPSECAQAAQRLAADRIRFPVVQPDETRRR